MNQLMIIVLVLVVFVWFGDKYVPSVLKQNKNLLLGVAVGLVLCSFMGLRLEGYSVEYKNKTWVCEGDCKTMSGSDAMPYYHECFDYFTQAFTDSHDIVGIRNTCSKIIRPGQGAGSRTSHAQAVRRVEHAKARKDYMASVHAQSEARHARIAEQERIKAEASAEAARGKAETHAAAVLRKANDPAERKVKWWEVHKHGHKNNPANFLSKGIH